MKTLFFILFLIPFFVYGEPLIGSIQVQTQNPQLKKSLERKLKTYRNEPFHPQKSNQIKRTIIRVLLQKKYRNSILRGPQVEPLLSPTESNQKDKVQLIFEIDHPYQYEFIFNNNKEIEQRRLFQVLKMKNLSPQSNFIKTSQNKIENFYQTQGFNNIRVESKIFTDDQQFKRKIIFTIDEGTRFKIRHFNFTGSYSRKERFYKKLFFSYASPLLKSKFYIKKDFDQTLKKMMAHLRRKGFLNAEIIHVNEQKNNTNVDIEIFLKEDQPITIKKIIIQGNSLLTSNEIKDILGIKEQTVFNLDLWEEGLNRLILQYYDLGYLDFDIANREQVLLIEKSLQTVDIILNLKEGKKTFIDNIQVKGNKEVDASFIIHASHLKKGTFITQNDLIKAQDFINDLQMFSNVQVSHETQNQKTNIIIEVKERFFRFLRFKLGANFENSQIPIEYIEKRFLNNDASEISLRFKPVAKYDWVFPLLKDSFQSQDFFLESLWKRREFFEYDFSAGYKHYYLWKSHFNLMTSYSKINSIFTLNEAVQGNSQWLSTHRFLLSLEKKFSLETILTFKLLELEFNESKTVENFQNIFNRESQILSLSGFSFYMDRRNNIFYPTSGQYFISTLDYSGPLLKTDPHIHFIRFESNYSFYIPLFSNIVWAQSLNGGYAHTFKEIPVTYMFVLGGPDSLRGYDEEISGDLISNQYNIEIENANSTFNQSSFYLLTKSEIRFPLYKQLKGAFFYDGGSIYLMHERPELRSYLHSVGLSLHYSLLVMNIGLKLKPLNSSFFDPLFKSQNELFFQFQIGSF